MVEAMISEEVLAGKQVTSVLRIKRERQNMIYELWRDLRNGEVQPALLLTNYA